jgi:hypothetical protein
MTILLAYSPVIIGLAILLVVSASHAIVRVRYANLPEPVATAVELRFPDSSTLNVDWSDDDHAYQIEVAEHGNLYSLEISPGGEILEISSDADDCLTDAGGEVA